MSSILIRRLDDETTTRLRIRAARHGHTMEREACEILQHALRLEDRASLNWVDAIRHRVERFGGIGLPVIPRGPIPDPPKF